MEKEKREAPIKLVFRILTAVVIFDFLYLFSTIIEEFFLDYHGLKINNFITYGALIDLSLIIIQILIIIYLFIKWFFLYYKIGHTHLTKKIGIFFTKDIIINYQNIKLIRYKQGLLGKIFNYGNLIFEMIGEDTTFTIRNIESPQTIVEIIQNTKNSNQA